MARWLPSKGAAGVSGPKRLPAAIATSRSRRPKRALRGALGRCNGAATFQGHHLPQRRLFAVTETAKTYRIVEQSLHRRRSDGPGLADGLQQITIETAGCPAPICR
ncbi:hypothetical protein XAC3824_690098 [Xanthomonas citri pv. citri]|nr:hypothetical protein XAC3824_690098 [Xanthomonas citri pv. citri]CEE66529.1 hypothetical protein XAC71A_760094 [Xanthomonas citri pv. citri]CEL34054.1 hypothetical protein XAC4311_1700039 [Xanthomonas citri pv. citri]